jgi:hypothetical protein
MATQNRTGSRLNCVCLRGVVFTAVAVLGLAAVGRVQAITTIGIDLGPASTITSDMSVPFDALDGISLAGQTLSINFTFTNKEFVRLFTITSASFISRISLQTNGSGVVGFLSGTGYLFDHQGNAIDTPQDLGSASGNDGSLDAGLLPLLSGELQRPIDFYGVHLDLTLPTNPLVTVTGAAQFQLLAAGVSTPFGIGPGVPRDIVPDAGSTLLLLGISLAGLMGARTWGTSVS